MATVIETVKTRTERVTRALRAPNWKAAVYAGLLSGALAWALRLFLRIPGTSAWDYPRRFASMMLKEGWLPYPGTFSMIYVAAAVPALALAVFYTAILSDFIHGRRGRGILAGLVYGLVLYGINYHLFTGIFPQFVAARHWTTIACYLFFGACAGWLYKRSAAARLA